MAKDKALSRTRRFRLAAGCAAILCAVAIAVLSLGPPSDGASVLGSDKTGHLLAYFALTALLLLAVQPARWSRAVLASFAYGGLMEFGQAILPFGREASWLDMAANTAGIAAALVLVSLVRRVPAR